jgi:hypothetical protein
MRVEDFLRPPVEGFIDFCLNMRPWERALAIVLLLALAIGLTGCTPPHPHPVPSPPPTPVPPAHGALQAQPNGTWTRDGAPWTMRMVIVCCKGSPDSVPGDLAKENNWPLTSKEFIDWISFHKQDATEIRPFMSPIAEHGRLFSPYLIATDDLKVDLNQWNPAFWSYVDDLLTYGEGKGVVFMVGVLDTWPQDHGLSPWCGGFNVNGVNLCDSGVLRGPFHELGQRFARKVYEETGKHANVIYQDGNESFEAMSSDWTLGMRDLLRQVEAEHHYVRHPYGTQQRDDGLRAAVDFVTVEQDAPVSGWCGGEPRTCKPTIVNENGLARPEQTMRAVYRASGLHSSFAFWMGELPQGDRGKVLIGLQEWAEGKPIPSWAAVADRCPNVAGIDVKIHQFICNNQTSPVPCVGGKVIFDDTPLFGKTGSGGRCNEEHDNCGGRRCEPPDGMTWIIEEAPRGIDSHLQNQAGCGSECPAVPCRDDRAYQQVLENLQRGHYRVRSIIDGQTDCDGLRLTRCDGPPCAGGIVEFDLP